MNLSEPAVRTAKKHRKQTPPFLSPEGHILPGSIAELHYHLIGGIEQSVMIRGENLENPVLIVLHGGPGLSDTAFFRRFNAALEKHFTMVYWDQRGVGKSYDPHIPKASMTVEQFISDLDDLVRIVCSRTGKRKITLFGHSWGSALGVLYADRFPRKVAVYVGCGQYGDWAASEAASHALAIREAERQGNHKALKELRSIGPPPYDADALLKERTWLQRLEGQLRPKAFWEMSRTFLGEPETSILDLPNMMRGFRFSQEAMWTQVSTINLHQMVPRLQMPVFFLLGRRDHWVPSETSVAYFEQLLAPSKHLVWFEESGHEPFADEPDKFNRTMAELVRPVVVSMSSSDERCIGKNLCTESGRTRRMESAET